MKTMNFHRQFANGNKFTLGLIYDPQNNPLKVGFGVALMNGKDNFFKKQGREIALGRAKKRPSYVISLEKPLDENSKETNKILKNLAQDIIKKIDEEYNQLKQNFTIRHKMVLNDRKKLRAAQLLSNSTGIKLKEILEFINK